MRQRACGLGRLFDALGISSLADFEPQVHIAVAAAGEVAGLNSPAVLRLVDAFQGLWGDLDEWLADHPGNQSSWAALKVAPLLDPRRLRRHGLDPADGHPRQQVLNARRDRLMQVYDDLPRIAGERLAFLVQLQRAAETASGIATVKGLGGRHRLRFWKAFVPGAVTVIGEYLGAEGGEEAWFLPVVRDRLFVRPPPGSHAWAEMDSRQLSGGYLVSTSLGVLRPTGPEIAALQRANERAEGTCFALGPLLMAARFGDLAFTMLSAHTSTSCPRISELRQLAADNIIQADPGGAWYYTARVKGGFFEDLPISPEAAQAAIAVADAIRRSNRLGASDPLPLVAPREVTVPLAPAQYLFQFGGRYLDAQTVTACLRFLLFRVGPSGGKELSLHAHLFRHGFANANLQAGCRLEAVADGLTHTDMETTRRRYGYPTRSQVCAAAQRRRP